ncbi:hypothetical protein [Ochrobactrum sp. 3-3]|uniref:hypothetical protein n=1 Tax=Ochrobactrum sp. 3-3 TaxID=1830124 RepID=UPI000DEEEA90|nr:hypothetical protein [Ochrobactrum sp. 3-3]
MTTLPEEAVTSATRRPWKVALPDDTLVLGPENQLVATTLLDEEDYQANYDNREKDAALIVKAVNAHDPAFKALREAYTALAFAFNRLSLSAKSRDGELCRDFGKVRGNIEAVFRNAGEKL